MQIEQWSIDKPKPYLRNARKISEKAIAKVAKSLAEFGWKQPLVVDVDGVIVVGHTRLLAAKRLGWNEVPVVVATDLTPAQVKAYRLMDNRSHDETDWDLDILNLELNDLSLESIDLALTGFELPEIERALLNGLDDAAADACPEAPETPVTRPGDVWVMGAHRLVCGDATKAEDVALAMGDGAKPNLMVTDPPYGVEYDPARRDDSKRNGLVTNDNVHDWSAAWRLFSGDVAYIWHASVFTHVVAQGILDNSFQLRNLLIWVKQSNQMVPYGRNLAQVETWGLYHWRHEPCWYAVRKGGKANWLGDRKQSTVWEVANLNPIGGNKDEKATGHGTQKPVELMRRPILNHTKRGDAVYDPFLGSGTTLIAAQELERVCYGLEIDPKYCDVIIQRWQQFTGKQAGLAVDGTGGGADGRTFEQVAYDRTEVLAE